MNGFAKRMAAMIPLVVVAATPALAAAPDAARMEEIVQSYVKPGKFMGAVLVVKDGQAVLDKGYGYANLEWQVPNTPETKFRLGSVTKQFTAAAIYMLADRGKLSVDDPVKKYVPEAPAAWDKITIYNLLTHTSGIPNFTAMPEFMNHVRNPATPAEELAWFKDKPLDFAPGSKWDYSNSNYTVLGLIVEKTSGATYQQFLADNIFKPLGMADSGYDSSSTVIARHATGYVPAKGGFAVAGFSDMSVPYAAGGLYSTTHDLLKWEQGLFGGKLLKPASLKKMTTPFQNNYASGVAVTDVAGRKVINHGGGIEGFNTHVDFVPTENLAVIVLGNLNGTAPDEIARSLVSVALGQAVTLPSERKAATIDPKSFDALVGVYQLGPNFALTFSRDGERFFGQGTGQPAIEIFALSEREFFAKAVDATFRFEADATGKVTQVILHQNNRDMPAKRVEK